MESVPSSVRSGGNKEIGRIERFAGPKQMKWRENSIANRFMNK